MRKTILALAGKPELQLSALAIASLAIYYFVLIRPYGLLEWWTQPGRTIAKIANYDPRIGAVYLVAILVLFLFAWLAARIVLRTQTRRTWAIIIAATVAFNALMLALYPVDAADIFDYIVRARMQVYYGANPFYQNPSSIPAVKNDSFYRYMGWPDVPTAYGPWWEMAAAAVARIPGNGVIENVLAFKGFAILAYFATLVVVGWTLKRHAPQRALYGVTFLAWNPLAVFSIAGNGHNDSVMILFLVLGFALMIEKHWTLAALAIVGGALVKFIPALVFPVIILAALQHLGGWWARIRYLAVTGLASAAMVAISYGHYWRGGDILGQDWRTHLFTTSLATLAKAYLEHQYDPKLADLLISRGAAALIMLWIAWELVRLWRRGSAGATFNWEPYVGAGITILLFYLLVTCLWFQPWYTLWAIGLAALLPDKMLSRGTYVVTIAGSLKMPIIDFWMQVRPGHVPPFDQRELQVTLGTLGLAWIYFAYQVYRRVQKRLLVSEARARSWASQRRERA